MDYWINTKSKMNLFKRDGLTAEIEAYLIAANGVDSYLIAGDLKIPVRKIMKWQRELGLRITANGGRANRYHVNMRGHNKIVRKKKNAAQASAD